MVVLVHAVREPKERAAHALLLRWLTRRDLDLTFIIWERAIVEMDLEEFGRVHQIDLINRWRLPVWLSRMGLRRVTRALRNLCVRWWWRDTGPEPAAIALGPFRAEMANYLPPGTTRLGTILGWRPPEGLESIDAVLAASTAIATTDAEARRLCRLRGDVDLASWDGLVAFPSWPRDSREREELSSGLGIPGESLLVAGLGPLDWRGGPDLFLRVAAGLQRSATDLPLRFIWLGGQPDGPNFYPYDFDTEHFGLGDAMIWNGEPDDYGDLLRRLDAIALVNRQPFRPPLVDPMVLFDTPTILRSLDIPLIGFDLPATEVMAGPHADRIPYPDVRAMTAALERALRGPRSLQADAMVDHLVGPARR